MKNHRFSVVFMLAILMLLTISGLASVLAQDAVEIPEVVVATSDEAPADFPDVVAEGVVKLTFENNRTEAPYSPLIARLNDGVTMEEFGEAMMSEDENAALALITLYGGQDIAPGTTASFWLDLIPGTYLAVEFAEDGPPAVENFNVEDTDAELPEGPEANATVAMVDFAFGIPVTHEAGEQVWRLMNVGKQWHEMGVFKIDEGMTLAEVQEAFGEFNPDPNAESGPPPFEPAFFWAPMGADTTAWVTVNLEPGTYAVVCFLPDLLSDFSPHFLHGMIQIITVE